MVAAPHTLQSLTADGRDRGLDYKISGFHVPPGCWDARVGWLWRHTHTPIPLGCLVWFLHRLGQASKTHTVQSNCAVMTAVDEFVLP